MPKQLSDSHSCPVSLYCLQSIRSPARTLLSVQLSLWSDPISFSVPKFTWWLLLEIQGNENLAETQMKKWWKFEHFLNSRTKWKVTWKPLNSYFRSKIMVKFGEKGTCVKRIAINKEWLNCKTTVLLRLVLGKEKLKMLVASSELYLFF